MFIFDPPLSDSAAAYIDGFAASPLLYACLLSLDDVHGTAAARKARVTSTSCTSSIQIVPHRSDFCRESVNRTVRPRRSRPTLDAQATMSPHTKHRRQRVEMKTQLIGLLVDSPNSVIASSNWDDQIIMLPDALLARQDDGRGLSGTSLLDAVEEFAERHSFAFGTSFP